MALVLVVISLSILAIMESIKKRFEQRALVPFERVEATQLKHVPEER